MTIAELLAEAAGRLGAAGVTTPELDAETLLRHVLGWDRATLVARGREPAAPQDEARFAALVRERARRRPLQHLTGVQAFWRADFLVTPDVLVPRPETELLVESALELAQSLTAPAFVDVGTGSGCIALSLAAERPDAVVHATDVSAAALSVARRNARRLGLEPRVRFVQGDLLTPLAAEAGRVDLVVSNPPYVDPVELPTLAPEVRDHEPRVAVLGEEPPYGIYRRLAQQSYTVLRPGGHLLVEVGRGMAANVETLLTAAGFTAAERRRDLQQMERVVLARRP